MTDASARAAAHAYLHRGWAPIPVPFQSKRPVLISWPELRLTEADLPRFFEEGAQNIGILLGEASGDLVDVDLDSPEARTLADQFLPPTKAIFGRASTPRSSALPTP